MLKTHLDRNLGRNLNKFSKDNDQVSKDCAKYCSLQNAKMQVKQSSDAQISKLLILRAQKATTAGQIAYKIEYTLK